MPKICCVCGNKAFGNNFGAITCDPCKAFFRRNALRSKFECLFDGKCNINQITRKFCQKCRLEKCFAVGMKKEFILNEEEKQKRKLKIECNRLHRKSSFSQFSDSESNSTEVFETNDDNNYISMNSETNDFNNNIENDFLFEALEDNNISAEQINQQIMEIEKSISSDNEVSVTELVSPNHHEHITDDVYQKVAELELSVIPIPRPIPQQTPDQFNDREMQILSELLSATHLIREPLTKITSEITSVPELRRAMSYKYDRAIKNFVKTSKSLRAFNSLCESDRIGLLKDHCFAILFMRSVMCYNYKTKHWTLFMDEDNSFLLKLELLRGHRKELYEAFESYFQKIIPVWDSDPMIMDLLTAIMLFNADRLNLIHKDVIKLQQHIYMHLLQRYLQIKYQSECESKSKFLRLMNTLVDINVLGELQRENISTRDPNELSPLLLEMLDMKPQNSITI